MLLFNKCHPDEIAQWAKQWTYFKRGNKSNCMGEGWNTEVIYMILFVIVRHVGLCKCIIYNNYFYNLTLKFKNFKI